MASVFRYWKRKETTSTCRWRQTLTYCNVTAGTTETCCREPGCLWHCVRLCLWSSSLLGILYTPLYYHLLSSRSIWVTHYLPVLIHGNPLLEASISTENQKTMTMTACHSLPFSAFLPLFLLLNLLRWGTCPSYSFAHLPLHDLWMPLISTWFGNCVEMQRLSLVKTVVLTEKRAIKTNSSWRTQIFPVFTYQKTDMQKNSKKHLGACSAAHRIIESKN